MLQKNMTVPALFWLFLTCLGGCAAPLATQGLSIGVPAAFDSTGKGSGDSAWLARYNDVVQATLDAGHTLSLKLVTQTIEKDKSSLIYIDDTGSEIKILIERRTETVTAARFDVGFFGSTNIGRLMVRQIIFEMAEADKFLRDWHPEEGD